MTLHQVDESQDKDDVIAELRDKVSWLYFTLCIF